MYIKDLRAPFELRALQLNLFEQIQSFEVGCKPSRTCNICRVFWTSEITFYLSLYASQNIDNYLTWSFSPEASASDRNVGKIARSQKLVTREPPLYHA